MRREITLLLNATHCECALLRLEVLLAGGCLLGKKGWVFFFLGAALLPRNKGIVSA